MNSFNLSIIYGLILFQIPCQTIQVHQCPVTNLKGPQKIFKYQIQHFVIALCHTAESGVKVSNSITASKAGNSTAESHLLICGRAVMPQEATPLQSRLLICGRIVMPSCLPPLTGCV